MIENMILLVKQKLPLKILDVSWDDTVFQMYGSNWSFNTLSAWRISDNNKIIFGCFDKDSIQLINYLKNIDIININFQTNFLKVDPVFILSNGQKIEVFSTDTYEPWTFQVDGIGGFIATPSDPNAFNI